MDNPFKTKIDVEVVGVRHPFVKFEAALAWPVSDRVYRALFNDQGFLLSVRWETLKKFSAQTRAYYFVRCNASRIQPHEDCLVWAMNDCNTVLRSALQAISGRPALCRQIMAGWDSDKVTKVWNNCGPMDPFSGWAIAEGCPDELLPVLLPLVDGYEMAKKAVVRRLSANRI